MFGGFLPQEMYGWRATSRKFPYWTISIVQNQKYWSCFRAAENRKLEVKKMVHIRTDTVLYIGLHGGLGGQPPIIWKKWPPKTYFHLPLGPILYPPKIKTILLPSFQTWSKVGFSIQNQNQKLDEVTFEHQNQKLGGHFWTSKSKVGFSLLNIKINSWMVTIEDQNQKQ